MIEKTIAVILNGHAEELRVQCRTSLADFIRQDRGYLGTRIGCEHGVCGACTIHIDGKPARSCLALAVQVDGRSVDTIEGLNERPIMKILQRQFHEHAAVQCGFCTSGMLMTAYSIVEAGRDWSRDQIRHQIGGNVCRCTGYQSIIDAIESALNEIGVIARAETVSSL